MNKHYLYYAHHLYKYNTPIEEYEKALIAKYMPEYEILNPNGDIQHEDLTNETAIMEKCFAEISRPDMGGLVFSSLNGVVGKGVYDEVTLALKLGMQVLYIENNQLRLIDMLKFRVINESRRIYAVVEDYHYLSLE